MTMLNAITQLVFLEAHVVRHWYHVTGLETHHRFGYKYGHT